jgi:hypothetical protein
LGDLLLQLPRPVIAAVHNTFNDTVMRSKNIIKFI